MHLAQVRATVLEARRTPVHLVKSKYMSLLLPSLLLGVGGADGLEERLRQSLLLVGLVKHWSLSTNSVTWSLLLFMVTKYKCQF